MLKQKAIDMAQYGYAALRQFPKSEKFALAADIKACMHRIIRLIITANKRYHKKTTRLERVFYVRRTAYAHSIGR